MRHQDAADPEMTSGVNGLGGYRCKASASMQTGASSRCLVRRCASDQRVLIMGSGAAMNFRSDNEAGVAPEIIAALHSRDLSHKGNQKRQDDYVRRTIQKATNLVRGESLCR